MLPTHGCSIGPGDLEPGTGTTGANCCRIQCQLPVAGHPVAEPELDELVDGVLADTAITVAPAAAGPELRWRNLYGEAERIAARDRAACTCR